MSNPILQKNYTAGAVIPAYRIVRLSSASTCVLAANSGDLSIGICGEVSPLAGERFDAVLSGIAYVEAGGAFALGARLTSDAQGRGIIAAPSAGSNMQIIGMALEASLASGDIVPVLISQSVMQG